jgi:hypothetical protein
MRSWLGPLLFIVLVLGPIGVGGFLMWHAHDFEQRATVTQGKVVNVARLRNQQTGDYEAVATVVYKDKKGGEHQRQLWSSLYSMGDAVTVRYDPENPDDAATGGGGYMAGAILMTIGLTFLGIVLQAVWKARAKPGAVS